MTKGGPVSFTHEIDSEDESSVIELQVSAFVTDFHPAVMYLRNGDPGYPAEGGEVEDLVVEMPDGSEMEPIPNALYNTLVDLALQGR